MTNKRVATPDDETQTPSREEISHYAGLLAELNYRKLETLKTRARAGELIDLNELDARTALARHYEARHEKYRAEAFGSSAPPTSASRRGH